MLVLFAGNAPGTRHDLLENGPLLTQPDLHRNHILVVDDELVARRLLVRMLEKGGPYTCRTAASTLEAKVLLEAEEFGLVITDSRMWGEEGIELVRQIGDEYPDTATIMVSGMDDGTLRNLALQSGASFFLGKPFAQEELLVKVAEALEMRDEAIKLRRHRDH